MSKTAIVPVAMLEQVYGMANEGCGAPNAAYRWCERIDEVFHSADGLDEYADYERPIPARPAVPDELIEEAAKAIYYSNTLDYERYAWAQVADEKKEVYRYMAECAARVFNGGKDE